jgi:hypothetical protein
LFREKWDEKHFDNGDTYGQATIQKALTSRDQNVGNAKEKSLDILTQNTQGNTERTDYNKFDKESIKPTWFSANELMKIDFPEPKWAIPGILPEGLNIFAGKPKHGKSILALNTAIAIASGVKALGKINVVQGEVIYFALEDTPRRLQNRLEMMLADPLKAPSQLYLHTECPRMDDGGLKYLEQTIGDLQNLRLVIIDTLAKFRPVKQNRNKNAYDTDYEHISRIKSLADKYSVSILLIHHLRKSDSEDIMDTFSGTFGLTGSADGLIALVRKTSQADAVLHITGRDVESADYAIKFDPNFLKWNLIGDAQEVKSTKKRQKLYNALKEATEPLGPKELSEMTELSTKYIKNTLPSLMKEGNIIKVSYGKYKFSKYSNDSDDPNDSDYSNDSLEEESQESQIVINEGDSIIYNNINQLTEKVTGVIEIPNEIEI